MRKLRFLICLVVVLLSWGCSPGRKSPVIGVSQCSNDIWRDKLNEELRVAGGFYGVEVQFTSADDDSEVQMEQIRTFVRDGVDLLIVSPNQTQSITAAVEEAFDAGIPVILFDRKINSDKYTAFMGADNTELGRVMGHYVADYLHGKGRVVEIMGLEGSSPAIERHQGFVEALQEYPGMQLVDSRYGGWVKEGGSAAMRQWQEEGLAFDAVFGQNDRMARGAWEVAGDKLPYFGVDALPGPGNGIEDVLNGVLVATYLYPTQGDRLMELAMDILNGSPFERENRLESALVDRQNARMMLMQEQEVTRQRENMNQMNSRLDATLKEVDTQRLVLILVIALAVVALLVGVLAYWSYLRIQELHRKLEESTEAKLSFFTQVSHEFRTPLTLISGPLEKVLASPLAPDQRKSLEIASRNADILRRFVGSILDFRKMESGKMPPHFTRFDLSAAVREWLGGFSEAAGGRELVLDLPSECVIEADMRMLERILYNLVSNSLKHTREDGRISVKLRADGTRALLEVEDDGEGIPADKLPLIFDEFYQAGTGAGTGIGLALVRGFVHLHKGDVKAESELGKGTRMLVRLPLSHPGEEIHDSVDAESYTESFEPLHAEEDSTQAEALERVSESESAGPSVLIVDDNKDIRDFVASVLRKDYRVLTACNGKEALEKALRELPDLVVSDIMMPVMDGLDLCRQLKAETATSHIPVILLTAKSLDEQRAEGYDSGADAYIAKPFSEKVLLSRVSNLLRSREALKAHYLETGGSIQSSAREDDFLGKMRRIIREHLAEPELSVEWLGDQMGLSRVQLFRKVKALTGYSPVEVIRITRLKEARNLLQSSDKSVSEIAYAVGFSSPSYFSKCYKELFCTLPAER